MRSWFVPLEDIQHELATALHELLSLSHPEVRHIKAPEESPLGLMYIDIL